MQAFELNGATIFWLITMGLLVGGIMKLLLGDKGMGIPANIIGGVVISLTCGLIAALIGFPGGAAFGALGSMGSLFLANAFHMIGDDTHPEGESPI